MPACPYCGGDVEQQPDEVVLTCPFCGTAFVVGGGEVGGHLMGRVNFTVQQVLETFKSWALRMPETPNDFLGAAHLKSYQLIFYPYWLYEVIGKVEMESGVEEEAVELALPAHSSMRGTPLEKRRLSSSGKVYYSHRHVLQSGGRVLNPDIGPSEADQLALSAGRQAVANKLQRRLGSGHEVASVDAAIAARLLVHVPTYVCTYMYRGGTYHFMADASDSRVIYAEVPIELKFRAAALGLGTASLLAALATLGVLATAPAFSLVTAVGFLTVGLFSVYKGLRVKVETRQFFASD